MNIISQLLDFDLSLLRYAHGLVSAEYAWLVQIAGELIVIYGAIVLIFLWLYGVYTKNNEYKKIALSIFFTIITVFMIYAIINLALPQWRLGAMEVSGGIKPLISHPIDNSFPSGHALFTASFLFGLMTYFRRSWLILLTIIIGCITLIARVIGGIHYPGDILGGLLFGFIGAYFLRSVVARCVIYLFPICLRIASWIRL